MSLIDDQHQAERDKYPMRAISNKQMAFGVGSMIGAIMILQPAIGFFTTREANDARLAAIEKSIDKNAFDLNIRLDRIATAMKERDAAMEARYNRESDHMITRIETLEAARMGVQKSGKNN